MPRKHGSEGQYVETVFLDDVLEVFGDVEGPGVILSADVADALDCSRETARRKLSELETQGRIDSRKVSNRKLYWRNDG